MQFLTAVLAFCHSASAMKQVQVASFDIEPCIFGSVTPEACDPHLDRLQVVEVDMPTPGPKQALVHVLGSSVNPIDWKHFLFACPHQTVGTDFAGVVETAGPECAFQAEDAVWGVTGGSGAYSEYVVQDCGYLSRKPEAYSFVQAGALGVVSITGLQAFRSAGAPWSSSPTVLILGGSGGTGHAAIQLAKALGAGRVITTCSPDNFAFVRSLGADEVIDYHGQDWATTIAPQSLHVIYDCVSLPGTGDKALPLLVGGGSFLTLQDWAQPSAEAKAARPEVSSFYVLANQNSTADLDVVAGFANEGKLEMVIQETYHGLRSVPMAFETMMEGHTVGKIGLELGSSAAGLLQRRRLRPHWRA